MQKEAGIVSINRASSRNFANAELRYQDARARARRQLSILQRARDVYGFNSLMYEFEQKEYFRLCEEVKSTSEEYKRQQRLLSHNTIKSNKEMKSISELWSVLKDSVGFDKMSRKQKLLCAWFGLSFLPLCVSGPWWFYLLAASNLGIAAYFCIKNVKLED